MDQLDLSQVDINSLIAELIKRGAIQQQGGFMNLSPFVNQIPNIIPEKPPVPSFPPYTLRESDCKTVWGYSVPKEEICTIIEAANFVAELRNQYKCGDPFIFSPRGFCVNGPSERLPWCISVNGISIPQNIQQLKVAQNINGIGAPGRWDFSGDVVSSRWHPTVGPKAPWDTQDGTPLVRN